MRSGSHQDGDAHWFAARILISSSLDHVANLPCLDLAGVFLISFVAALLLGKPHMRMPEQALRFFFPMRGFRGLNSTASTSSCASWANIAAKASFVCCTRLGASGNLSAVESASISLLRHRRGVHEQTVPRPHGENDKSTASDRRQGIRSGCAHPIPPPCD